MILLLFILPVPSSVFSFPSLSCTILEQRTRYPAKCRRHKLQEKLMLLQSEHRRWQFVKKRRSKMSRFTRFFVNLAYVKHLKKSMYILKVVKVVSVLRVTLFKSYLQHKSREYLELYLIKKRQKNFLGNSRRQCKIKSNLNPIGCANTRNESVQ